MAIGLTLPPQIRVYAAFFIYSFCMGSLYPRIPAIQQSMGVGEGALGFALIGPGVGTLISLTFAGPVLERIGYRRVLLTAIPLLSVLYAVAVWAQTPLALFLLLIPVGLTLGCIEIIINLEADRVEHAIGRRIMSRSHAFWSFGFFASGLAGSFIAQTGLSVQMHLMLMIPVVFAGVLLLLGRYQPASPRTGGSEEAAPRFAAPTLSILALVCVCLSAMVMEGAGIDWSAIYMRDVFGADPFWAGFAVALVAGSMAVARYFADGFVERHSPRGVAQSLIAILGVGVVLILSAPHPAMAYLGLVLLGIGSSALFPIAMSAAAQRSDRPAAVNVASLAQISFVAFLIGPPLLGYIAEHFGIRWAFGVGLPLVIFSLLATRALGRRPVAQEVPAQ